MMEPNEEKNDEPKTPAKMLIYDFDCTISVEHVYHNLNRQSRAKLNSRYDSSTTPAARQLEILKKVSAADLLKWFGGKDRVLRLSQHFTRLQENKVHLVIISHGFESVVKTALAEMKLDKFFQPELIYGNDSKGLRDCQLIKCKLICQIMKAYGLRRHEVIFIDDDKDNLDPCDEGQLCKTLLVASRKGLSDSQLDQLEAECKTS